MKRRLLPLLRPILALLTVLASFMFQVRVEALGGLGEMRPVSAAQVHGMRAHETHGGETQSSSQAPSHMGHHRHAPPPAPREPDPHASHGAHCPFCLTNAFALEAGLVGLPQGPPDYRPQPVPSASPRVSASVRHADARAPPFEL